MPHLPGHGLLTQPYRGRSAPRWSDGPVFGQRPQNIWDAVQRFLNPETPAETAAVVGTSMIEPAGTIMDATDLYIGLRDRDLPRAGFAGAGLLLPMVSGRLMREGGSRAIDAAADALDELPMDETSRLARKGEWLEPSSVQGRVYHGTTHGIDEFDPTVGEVGSHYGRSVYFSDSPIDVEVNYARVDGPDITNRIELEQERLMNLEDLDEAEALAVAKKRIRGEHEGAMIPAHLRLENPVDLRPNLETRFEYEFDLSDLGPEPHWDSPKYDEWIEARDEIMFGSEPSGSLPELIRKVQTVGYESGVNTNDIVDRIREHALDFDGIGASDFEKIVRSDDQVFDAFDDITEESFGPGEFLRRVYEAAGYDGTIIDAAQEFGPRAIPGTARKVGGMEGVEGATHYAVFDPRNIRSPFAKFDPSRRDSADLLAGLAGLLAAGSIRARDRDNYVER